ncbi:Fc receptor-like protein 5 [Oenanthe melanoleuca]|uniref:Fc receptor-like protein 5 n=1 Tax=Oenanthe melanoleuca TaxID=2939378 RepID=UPI0024C1E746|nr:Fc receptor-like protein 5 [Oenanthe melanoleuca]
MAGDTGMAGKVALLLWAQTLGLAGAQSTQLLVEPPWTPAVLWDRVTLTCQGSGTTGDTTWYKDRRRWWQKGPEHFTVTESGTYTCDRPGTGLSPPVMVSNERLVLQLPARALLEGDTVTLRCRGWQDATVTGVRFYHGDKDLGGPLCGTELSLSPLQLHHSGRYRCGGWVSSGPSPCWEKSAPVTVTVTVHVPVANATITPGPPALQVCPGDPVTLRCSVQVGSAPVTFTWLHNGHEVAQGPLLELGDIDVGHSGTYQCVATNQLGQDGHRVFQALSPELALEVTPQGTTGHHWNTEAPWVFPALVIGSLLFLVLLMSIIVAFGGSTWVSFGAARKHQERAPPLEDPQATYMELQGPHGQPWELSDIYGNLQQKL